MLTAEQRHILRHTLGLERGPVVYRNHFATDVGTTDYPVVAALVGMGLMKPGHRIEPGDHDYRYYHATPDGIAAVRAGTVVDLGGRSHLDWAGDPSFVYVGRAVPRLGWKASPFANPFRVCRRTPEFATPSAVVREFGGWLEGVILGEISQHAHPKLREHFTRMARLLPELKGKALGCWCCDWDGEGEPSDPCHAVVLARLANAPVKP
jgi:hypothetical protein